MAKLGLVGKVRLEVLLAAVASVAAIGTLVQPNWIEQLFGVDPDHGSGTLELLIVVAFTLIALLSAWSARSNWMRLRPDSGEHSA